ncbi:MAG: sensor histidine kinase, partial [Acidobacteria bacterium]|nr:sensor histidine kinase [Acidobacteriota bacterium]
MTTLKEAEAVLAEQIDSKDRFLASISHELRTPITAVAGFANELATSLDTFDSAEARELLSLVAREASDVAGIVDDLLV